VNRRQIPPLGFTPGIKIPSECFDDPSGNICPAQIPSGNLFVTSSNRVVNEKKPNEDDNDRGPNVLQVTVKQEGESLFAINTLATFAFPPNFQGKRCVFHFIHDEGDHKPNDIYEVFELENQGANATDKTNWATKPARTRVIATFDTRSETQIRYSTAKFSAPFLTGPGFTPNILLEGNRTFPCPSGGKVVFEIASQNRHTRGEDGGLNVGGNSGLGIEILGSPTPWFGFKAAIRRNNE
jgi:hypothetical protein